MKRSILATAILFSLGGLVAGFGLSNGTEAPSAAAPPADDPCAAYIADGVACEFVAFPETEIVVSLRDVVAKR
ncbi:MAG: hypothetical protein H6745_30125 [Deltaproteobacteria bacterium]|nr:hypothetical protein [Deltaproteobacteria bacterium]